MSAENPKVTAFIHRARQWQGEMQKLRTILLGCGLDEEIKWGKPCYQFAGTNVAIVQPFKAHCALMFFQGALLEDTAGRLRSQGENSQAARRLEFTSEAQVEKAVVQTYVKQAIAVAQSGRKVDLEAKRKLVLPAELTQRLQQDRQLERAFHALTQGRQRGYVLHFTSARQSATRSARIEACIQKILAGEGLHDR